MRGLIAVYIRPPIKSRCVREQTHEYVLLSVVDNQSLSVYAVSSYKRAFVLKSVNTVKHVVLLSMKIVNSVVKSADSVLCIVNRTAL